MKILIQNQTFTTIFATNSTTDKHTTNYRKVPYVHKRTKNTLNILQSKRRRISQEQAKSYARLYYLGSG